MDFTGQQAAALDKIQRWHADAKEGGDQRLFRLFGYAGTGKTTLAKAMAGFADKVQYCALTGKAALVLRSKGCENARTIHGMIYRSQDKSRVERDRLKAELAKLEVQAAASPEAMRKLQTDIAEANRALQQPSFALNENAFIRKWDDDMQGFVYMQAPDLLVVDECSMVDRRVGGDLMSFKIPILVLGDPAQLPPVMGGGFFTGTKASPIRPDALLTEIHRQASGNPILQIATKCRESGMPPLGQYGTSRIVEKTALNADEWLAADIILCGRNETRGAINRRIRQLRGHTGLLPEPGEQVVCLRNNHEKGLLNGSMWQVEECEDIPNDRFFSITLRSLDDADADTICTLGHKKPFLGQGFEDSFERRDADEFDFGYAITTHKAQGSEWPNVIYVDEWNRPDKKQHQYTGVTRASETITVVKW